MAVVTLDQAKKHLRVTNSDENDLIQIYINAAEDYIRKLLNTPNYPNDAAIQAGALLVIGDLYANREGQTVEDIKPNPAVMALLHPYRENIGI